MRSTVPVGGGRSPLPLEQCNNMKRILIVCLGAWCVAGCSSVNRAEATKAAIDKGLVQGIPASSHLKAIIWGFPGKPPGPYGKLGGLTAFITTNGPDSARTYVFYLGKSRETKDWEVFASMVWKDGKWEPVPVKLPQEAKQQ